MSDIRQISDTFPEDDISFLFESDLERQQRIVDAMTQVLLDKALSYEAKVAEIGRLRTEEEHPTLESRMFFMFALQGAGLTRLAD